MKNTANDTIRNSLKKKFNQWIDERCNKGLETYGHELDDCPTTKFDWRDMLIEELLDGLQYQEKEIKRLKADIHIANNRMKTINPLVLKPTYLDLDDE